MSCIEVRNVSKTFGEKTALTDFSCSFEKGKVTCITGASGSGKTTLLRLLAGLVEPDAGEIRGVPEKKSFVFQEDRLCEDFTAAANVRLVCGKKTAKSEISAHLSELSLTEDKRPVREYSGGMKRRVAIARAILYDADLILMDEPFKGLDESLRISVMDYVKRHTVGKTVLIVTHDPSEPSFFGADIVEVKRSKVQ